MNITLECMPCFVRHTLEVLKEFSSDDELNERVLRRVLNQMSELDFTMSPPEFAAEIHDFIRLQLQCDDPYAEIKQNSNELARKLTEELADRVKCSVDPFRVAVLYSIAGNIIDSGVSARTTYDEIVKSIEMAELEKPAIDDYDNLLRLAQKAERILVLGDNAGEIFFDRLLLQNFSAEKKLFYAVKQGAILNDATKEDAIAAGLDDYARIIDNGTRYPGTPMSKVSDSFKAVFAAADLIISKGQANFETLSHSPDPRIFFLLRAKCGVIARKAGVPQGSFLILQNREKIV
ncbi:MAG: damage-control phosphatase ARMT1 family protein [Candidatus Rifleibacteriota bacterium]